MKQWRLPVMVATPYKIIKRSIKMEGPPSLKAQASVFDQQAKEAIFSREQEETAILKARETLKFRIRESRVEEQETHNRLMMSRNT